jgi:hypothetical protein
MSWFRAKPGLYHLNPEADGPFVVVDRGTSGLWWWLVADLDGRQYAAGRAMDRKSASVKAMAALRRLEKGAERA